MELNGRRGRRSKQLPDDLEGEKKVLELESGSTRMHSVENSCGTGYGSVVRQTTLWMMNKYRPFIHCI